MLAALGIPSVETLVTQAVPKSIRLDRALDLPAAASEAKPGAEAANKPAAEPASKPSAPAAPGNALHEDILRRKEALKRQMGVE